MSIKDSLYQPFGDVPTRRGRGGVYSYVRWQDVADRMNQVFGARWSSEVVFQEIIGSNIIIRVSVCIKDPDTGERFCQEGFGGAPNDEAQEAGTPFKSAYSKALKDACRKWGVALFLDDESPASSNTPKGFNGKEFGKPLTMPSTSSSQVDSNMTTPTMQKQTMERQTTVPVSPKQSVPSMPTKASSMPTKASSMPTLGNSLPSPPPMSESINSGQQTNTNTMPSPPPMSESINSGQQTNAMPSPSSMGGLATNGQQSEAHSSLSKTNEVHIEEVELISDVQKAALHSILKLLKAQNVEYEDLAKEAFELNNIVKETIPKPEELTYQEAVYVVKHGNDKFRKQ